MNAAQRAALDHEPVPSDPAGNLAIACAIRQGGTGEWRTAFLVGTRKQAFGPPYATARAAAEAAHYINQQAGQ